MKQSFLSPITSKKLFCRRCQVVSDHKLMAQDAYSISGGMQPHIPLLCSCKICGTYFIAYSQEFNFFCDSHKSEYTKILGHNRIQPGNWLYIKNKERPGKVKSVFKFPKEELITISYQNNYEEQIKHPISNNIKEVSSNGYKLFPAQTGQALIGDHIYHTRRELFGEVVGKVLEAEKEKLAVLLENKTLLFITLPEKYQAPPKNQLLDFISHKISKAFAPYHQQLNIQVSQGIVCIRGSMPSLALKNKLKLFIKNIPSLKGCINLVEVQPLKPISDTIIKARVLTILEDLSIPISNYEVSVQNAVVQIKCCYHNCSTPTDLEQRIEQIEGIKELNLILDFMPVQPLFQEKWFQNAEKALHKNPKLEGSKIRISYHGKKILLEGNVHSLFQKSRAYIATMLSTKKISIENKLRISPYTEEQDVI